MARKDQTTASGTTQTARKRAPAAAKSKSTPARVEPTHEAISVRAHEIHVSGEGGSDLDDWLRAERELLESA